MRGGCAFVLAVTFSLKLAAILKFHGNFSQWKERRTAQHWQASVSDRSIIESEPLRPLHIVLLHSPLMSYVPLTGGNRCTGYLACCGWMCGCLERCEAGGQGGKKQTGARQKAQAATSNFPPLTLPLHLYITIQASKDESNEKHQAGFE